MTHQDKLSHTTPPEQQGAGGSDFQGHKTRGVRWLNTEQLQSRYQQLASLKPAPQVTASGTTKSYMRFCEEHGHWSSVK